MLHILSSHDALLHPLKTSFTVIREAKEKDSCFHLSRCDDIANCCRSVEASAHIFRRPNIAPLTASNNLHEVLLCFLPIYDQYSCCGAESTVFIVF